MTLEVLSFPTGSITVGDFDLKSRILPQPGAGRLSLPTGWGSAVYSPGMVSKVSLIYKFAALSLLTLPWKHASIDIVFCFSQAISFSIKNWLHNVLTMRLRQHSGDGYPARL